MYVFGSYRVDTEHEEFEDSYDHVTLEELACQPDCRVLRLGHRGRGHPLSSSVAGRGSLHQDRLRNGTSTQEVLPRFRPRCTRNTLRPACQDYRWNWGLQGCQGAARTSSGAPWASLFSLSYGLFSSLDCLCLCPLPPPVTLPWPSLIPRGIPQGGTREHPSCADGQGMGASAPITGSRVKPSHRSCSTYSLCRHRPVCHARDARGDSAQ